jgi:WD40 repeat protein
VNTVVWNDNGDILLSGSDDCKLNIYKLSSAKVISFSLHNNENLHFRLIFNPGQIQARKTTFKSSKIPKFGREMFEDTENIALRSSQIFCFLYYVSKLLPFLSRK